MRQLIRCIELLIGIHSERTNEETNGNKLQKSGRKKKCLKEDEGEKGGKRVHDGLISLASTSTSYDKR